MLLQLFVDKLRWCTYLVFTELLMLGQCIPGPTSTQARRGRPPLQHRGAGGQRRAGARGLQERTSATACGPAQHAPHAHAPQMGFAIGVLKKGLSGGLVSGVLFQGPGFLILSILGWVAAKVLNNPPGWLSGLVAGGGCPLAAQAQSVDPCSERRARRGCPAAPLALPVPPLRAPPALPHAGLAAAGIALVAGAAKGLVRNICKGRLLEVLCTLAAVVAYYWPEPW